MVMSGRKSLTKFAAVLFGILGVTTLASGLVCGQEFSATMSGVVRDAGGGLVPGVSVMAKHTESGLTRTVITNETGSPFFESGYKKVQIVNRGRLGELKSRGKTEVSRGTHDVGLVQRRPDP